MKQLSKMAFSIVSFMFLCTLHAHTATPTLTYRSQGFHGDRQRNVSEVGKIHLRNMDSWYVNHSHTVGYMRSFHAENIAHCLFGHDLICNDECSNTIKVQGSSVTSRDPKAWLADYFYLSCDYDGRFSINPRIQNVIIDTDFYVGLDNWIEGSYFRIYGPIAWTKWQTQFCAADPAVVTTTSCSTGYFTPTGEEVLLSSIAHYFAGSSPNDVGSVVFKGLKYAKMPACKETKLGFAELRAELGWNFLQRDDYHLGIGLHVAAPTGNRRRAEFVMQPVVGNGNHWELGGTLHGHYLLWKSSDEEKRFTFTLDAVLTHIFRGIEQRTFDLCGKENSRYMLAAKFNHDTALKSYTFSGVTHAGTNNTGAIAISSQFDNIYTPVANLTTTNVKVSSLLQADVTALLTFEKERFAWDLGYNFWARTCEKIYCPRECNPCNVDSIFNTANANKWALKGDARMFGFAADTVTGIDKDNAVPLSATQSKATIHSGTNATFIDATLTSVTKQNGGVDNPLFAIVDTTARVIHTPTTQGGLNVNSNQIKTSVQPIFLTPSDVSLHGTRGLSHKIFTHLSYTFDRKWNPYLGIGGSAEFGQKNKCDSDCNSGTDSCSTNCSTICSTSSSCSTSSCSTSSCGSCDYCSLSQWSAWVKGGISFD